MKKIAIVLCAAALSITSCKKKEEAPTPTPTPAPVTYLISVKVDGTEKKCNSCYSGSKSGGIRSSYFYLDGFNEQIYFSCDTFPSLGAHTLVKYGEPYLVYIKDNTYYRATNGTMNITAIDTSANGVVNKLTATFKFQTDTTGDKFFNITDGSINLKK